MELILKHRDSLLTAFNRTIHDRAEFAAQLAAVPLVDNVYPSGGNFLLVSLHCPRNECQRLIETLLRDYSIYVKDVSSRFHGQASFLRLAVRLPAENARLVACLRTW